MDNDQNLGTTVKGRYLIERELGRGGIGAVYLARDQQLLGKPVVLKVLLERSFQDEWAKRKFYQEIEALTRIDHPGIVSVLDAGEMPDGKPYFVMQYVEGETLRSLLNGSGIELELAAHIIRQLGQALTAAHDKGVYHRDLKPANIMLQIVDDEELRVKIIDFGIARVEDSQAGADTVIPVLAGTLHYMAPEQIASKPITPATDVYALGVIAYELVTGNRPFNPKSVFHLADLQRAGVKVTPAELRPNLPARAQQVIMKALSYNPEQRYQCARDFGDELAQALLSGEAPVMAGAEVENVPSTDVARNTPTNNPVLTDLFGSAGITLGPNVVGPKVAILYRPGSSLDMKLYNLLETVLYLQGYCVLADTRERASVEWARDAERRMQTADFVVALLSAEAVASETFAYQVQIASEAAQLHGRPRLVPVLVDYDKTLPESLASSFDEGGPIIWRNSDDDEQLVGTLLEFLQSPPPPRSSVIRKLEPIGGAVPLDSKFYIVRATDDEFLSAIARHESIVLVKGARQMGKTSLLARGLQQAREAGARVVLTDFQKLNAAHLQSIDAFFQMLAEIISDQLDLDMVPEDVWTGRQHACENFANYWREVLRQFTAPVVWGMDEVDRLFTCSFGSEVFGLFRSWNDEWARDERSPWRRLTLAIAYATEAHLFITDMNQSPFNVGTRLVLDDFNFEQVEELNKRYGSPLKERAEVARYFRLVGGHPYLVRKGLHEMTSRHMTLKSFEREALSDDGPFGDHLGRILILLAHDADLSNVLREMVKGRSCPDEVSFYRLRSAGVVIGDSARDARPRCQLYAAYLERHLL